ncbi:hypothetical protein QL285_052673 [Trifolium repens]|nr:hypothetical protein QL285_052673 [Trifolium repens]
MFSKFNNTLQRVSSEWTRRSVPRASEKRVKSESTKLGNVATHHSVLIEWTRRSVPRASEKRVKSESTKLGNVATRHNVLILAAASLTLNFLLDSCTNVGI